MPPGGAWRNNHAGLDSATTVPAESTTCVRTNDDAALPTGRLTDPDARSAVLYVAIREVLGVGDAFPA